MTVDFLILDSIDVRNEYQTIPPDPMVTLGLIEIGAPQSEIEESRKEHKMLVCTEIIGTFIAAPTHQAQAVELLNSGNVFAFEIPAALVGKPKMVNWVASEVETNPIGVMKIICQSVELYGAETSEVEE